MNSIVTLIIVIISELCYTMILLSLSLFISVLCCTVILLSPLSCVALWFCTRTMVFAYAPFVVHVVHVHVHVHVYRLSDSVK